MKGCFATKAKDNLQIIITLGSLFGCVWLGYVLMFILQDFCIVCFSTYLLQITIFVLTLLKKEVRPEKMKQQ